MKHLLLILSLLIVSGCERTKEQKIDLANRDQIYAEECTCIIEKGGCQYIVLRTNGCSITHHAACKNPIHKK